MEYEVSKVRISGVIKESIVDGHGLRFVIFAQGCCHNCKGCHNPETHNLEGGYLCNFDSIIREIDKNPMITGITFSGGEPFLQAKAFSELVREIKKMISIEKRIISEKDDTRRIVREEYPRNFHLLAYTGFKLEKLIEVANSPNEKTDYDSNAIYELLHQMDAIIDGPFILEEKDLTLKFKGSKNQRYLKKEEIVKIIEDSKRVNL